MYLRIRVILLMKICLINNLYKPYERGGAEKVVEKIVDESRTRGDEVFVISLSPRKGKKEENDGNKKNYYLPSAFFSLEKTPFILRFFYHIWDSFNIINYFKIRRIIKKEKPDVIWTHSLKGVSILIATLPKKLKIKHYHTLHDIQLLHPSGLMFYQKEGIINSFGAKVYQFINKFFIDSPDKIISPSKWLLDIHRGKGFFPKSEIEVSPNFEIKKITPKGHGSVIKFIYVGQIEKHKGIKMLIEVFLKISKKNIKLIVVGPGSMIEEVKKISLNDDRIDILGRKKNEEVLSIMKESDYLVVPSLCYENSPTVIYEASNLNLPILASSLGGIPELINQSGGELFKPNKEDLERILLSKCLK